MTAPALYSPDNPFAKRQKPDSLYHPDNPFAPKEPDEKRGVAAGVSDVINAIKSPVQTIRGMGNAIAEGLNKATSPVIGTPQNLLRFPLGRTPGTVSKENAPNAVTPGEFGKGVGESAINVGFTLAPELAIPVRAGVNATLGALHSPEDRLRGATSGLVLGEALHGAAKLPETLSHIGDVSHGMMESAANDLANVSKGTSPPELMNTKPLDPMSAAAIAGGRTYSPDNPFAKFATDASIPNIQPKGRAPKAEPLKTKAGIIKASGGIVGRERPPLLGEQPTETPQLVGPTGEPVAIPKVALRSFEDVFDVTGAPRRVELPMSGIKRRPATEVQPTAPPGEAPVPRSPPAPNAPTPIEVKPTEGGGVTVAPKPPTINPIAAANGAFEARPGVLRQVNRELDKGPTASANLPRIKQEEMPDLTPRITVEEANRRVDAAVEAQKAAQVKQAIRRSRWAPGESIRDEAGALRKDLTNVPDDVLEAELQRIREQNTAEEAQAAAVRESGYRDSYEELPLTERVGRGQENDRINADNKTTADYNQRQIIRQARERAATRLEAELAARKPEKYQRIDEVATPHEPDTSFDFGANVPENASPSDVLNIAKLNLLDKTAQDRVAAQLENHRALRESNKQTFAEADVNRRAIYDELLGGDRMALAPAAAKKLSGEELLARRDVVSQNDNLVSHLSKVIDSKTLPAAEHEQAIALMQKAVEHNDALLSDLVTGSSQKGRDLNLLRRIANRDLDPATWQVQAKRMLGDRPLTDEIGAEIRRLATAAQEACK